MDIEKLAKVAHDANRAYCASIGDDSQKPWEEAPEWQRASAVVGVRFVLSHPDAPVSATHDSWLKEKFDAGWKYGPVKDPTLKLHPCCVLYEQLPEEQKKKDALFQAIVRALG